jgi:hypothetical protein
MGEMIKSLWGEEMKIGTCENLYYARYAEFKENRHRFTGMPGNDTPTGYLQPNTYRFRFPFPDEDGKFGNGICTDEKLYYDRGFLLSIPKTYKVEIAHSKVFNRKDFERSDLAKLAYGHYSDCPQDPESKEKFFKWNYGELLHIEVVQQKLIQEDGKTELQTVVRCPTCGDRSRLSFEEVNEIAKWTTDTKQSKEVREVVDRMLEGYLLLPTE